MSRIDLRPFSLPIRLISVFIFRRPWPKLSSAATALPTWYFDHVGKAVAAEDNFGHGLRKMNTEINRIGSENGRKSIRDMYTAAMSPEPDFNSRSGKFYAAMS